MKRRKCSSCGAMRPLDRENFRPKGGGKGFEGVCTTCSPVTVNEMAQRAVRKVKRKLGDPPRHNHVTRDIKPRGQCPGCDEYHDRQEAKK